MMWETIFVFNHKDELRPPQTFPPFSKGGEVMLMLKDTFDQSLVPKTYTITQVIFDVYSVKQYVHLLEVTR